MYKEFIENSNKSYIYVDFNDEEHIACIDDFISKICIDDVSLKDFFSRERENIKKDKQHIKNLIQVDKMYSGRFSWMFISIQGYDKNIQVIDVRDIDLHKKNKRNIIWKHINLKEEI